MDTLKSIFVNWETSIAGAAVICGAFATFLSALSDGDPSTPADIATLIAGISAGTGLILARTATKSTEQSRRHK